MDENDKPDGSTAMERLARELMGAVVSCAPTVWCGEHGIGIHGTRPEQDREHARADARADDSGVHPWTMYEMAGLREKSAGLDALCRVLNAESADEAVAVARSLVDEHCELKELREAGRVMPEGVSWPMYADGEPVRFGDVMRGTGRSQHVFRVVGVAPGNGRMTVVCEDVDEDCELCYTDPRLLAHERPDSWGRLREDVRKDYTAYWGCIGFCCDKCPALVDGKKPSERYDTAGCNTAEQLDLLVRAERLAGVRDDG